MPAYTNPETDDQITLTLRLPLPEAEALAQLCKRFTSDDAIRFSNRHDHGAEYDAMMSGILLFQRALADAGFAPR
jgi:hypothetical protein